MNNLSWFLYLADVFGSLQHVMSLFSFISFFACGGFTLFYFITKNEAGYDHNTKNKSPMMATAKILRNIAITMIPIFLFSITIAVLLPEKKTMYLIALSEFGERVATNENVVGIASEANDVLRAYLTKMKKELLP